MTSIDVTSIELRSVTRWYGNVVAVNDITMSIGPGVTGLLGPNGAGKSTLLHLIAGFLAPSRGELTVAGEPSWRNPGLFRKVGLVPERDSTLLIATLVSAPASRPTGGVLETTFTSPPGPLTVALAGTLSAKGWPT